MDVNGTELIAWLIASRSVSKYIGIFAVGRPSEVSTFVYMLIAIDGIDEPRRGEICKAYSDGISVDCMGQVPDEDPADVRLLVVLRLKKERYPKTPLPITLVSIPDPLISLPISSTMRRSIVEKGNRESSS